MKEFVGLHPKEQKKAKRTNDCVIKEKSSLMTTKIVQKQVRIQKKSKI